MASMAAKCFVFALAETAFCFAQSDYTCALLWADGATLAISHVRGSA